MKIKISLLIGLLICLPLHAQSEGEHAFFEDHARGWFWYEVPEQAPENKEQQPHSVISEKDERDPVEQLNAIRETINRSLAKAMIEPTTENVEKYLVNQTALTAQAHQFARTWQKVLLENPDLNYALVRPTNSVGAQVYLEEKKKAKVGAIQKLAQESGLFFFYRSSCPYCQKFAPILKAFSERYGLAVIPITTDGISLPEFPDSMIDNGQSAKFNVQVEPSLFAVNPYTQKAYPIAYGLITEDELSQRIYDIANEFMGDKL